MYNWKMNMQKYIFINNLILKIIKNIITLFTWIDPLLLIKKQKESENSIFKKLFIIIIMVTVT